MALSLLSQLLHSCPVEDFYDAYYEKKYLQIKSANSCLFQFNTEMFKVALLKSAFTHPENIRANKEGNVYIAPLPMEPYQLYDWAMEKYNNGATLILNQVELNDDLSKQFAIDLGKDMKAYISLTAFLTPENSQGFSPHFDTHDVFVMQMSGSKEWHIGDFEIELATRRQGFLVSPEVMNSPHTIISMFDNDILYLPRGMVHWAFAEHLPSLHVTVDIDSVTYSDLLLELILQTSLNMTSKENKMIVNLFQRDFNGNLIPELEEVLKNLKFETKLFNLVLEKKAKIRYL
ncbi:ribosomal protein L16 Arg81 hydroxylase [Chryseobacterium defluvii]|uniref:Ribosomal protein L16 Arg81 hydroxylase n=1 Tax=Chryseobacterium defluvii TaxID=160396 RepID=A0A840KCW1_9FLAO|nr:cupin domain-containing protein [Chryseobacterium defluvii]MBB4807016.1 ribosomal protein L16 Arg81 hydroxylase [Chryseobacterium defluvii]